MALFDHTDREIDKVLDITREKKLSKFLGTNSLLNVIRAMPKPELGNFRVGAAFLTLIFGSMGYYFYKRNYQQKMQSSHGFYRLMNVKPINAGAQFMWLGGEYQETSEQPSYYYRMPKKEFDALYRMKSAYIDGEFDHTKEILLPKKKDGVAGYEVITPFYYYWGEIGVDPKNGVGVTQDGKPVEIENYLRNAIAVKRGW
jgi:hypothetical protein